LDKVSAKGFVAAVLAVSLSGCGAGANRAFEQASLKKLTRDDYLHGASVQVGDCQNKPVVAAFLSVDCPGCRIAGPPLLAGAERGELCLQIHLGAPKGNERALMAHAAIGAAEDSSEALFLAGALLAKGSVGPQRLDGLMSEAGFSKPRRAEILESLSSPPYQRLRSRTETAAQLSLKWVPAFVRVDGEPREVTWSEVQRLMNSNS
jgi:hypothetical protein